jgi:hypothetical protein
MSDVTPPTPMIHTAYRVDRETNRDVAAMQAHLLYRMAVGTTDTEEGQLLMGAATLMYALADGSATVRFASFHSNTGIY